MTTRDDAAVHQSVTFDVDVAKAFGASEPVNTRVTVLLPDPSDLPSQPVVAFAVPGAGYNRHYFTFDMPGSTGGGQAGWHARRGWIFVAIDAVGVGEASLPGAALLTPLRMAAANHATVLDVLRRLAAGEVSKDYVPIQDPVVLGLGQSMGGGLVLMQQAHHDSYDGIALLGFSATYTSAPGYPGARPPSLAYVTRDAFQSLHDPQSAEERAAVAVNKKVLELQGDAAHYVHQREFDLRWGFHFDDVPSEVVARDFAVEGEPPEWRSPTVPGAVFALIGPGVLAPEAAAIVVPVLSAFGERDVSEDPRIEHKAFRHAVDFSAFVCPRMAHMHNFASSREVLWTRIQHWGEHVAALKSLLPERWPSSLFSDSR